MKYLSLLLAIMLGQLVFSAPVSAQKEIHGQYLDDGSVYHEGIQNGDTIVVEARFGSSKATITPVSSGVAKIEMNPVYLVALNEPVAAGKSTSMGSDVTGKGTVNIARVGRQVLQAEYVVCWRGVNIALQACGPFEGLVTTALLNVGSRRNEMILLYPALMDRAGSEEISLVAHPHNTQAELTCGRFRTMVSLVYVDGQGTIRIPELSQIAAFQKAYSDKCRR